MLLDLLERRSIMELEKTRREVNKLLNERKRLKQNIRSESDTLSKLREHAQHVVKAREIVQSVAQLVQQKAHDRIAGVVTKCLQAVFPDPYEFRIIFEQRKGRTDARMVFIRNNMEIDPCNAAGGGILDVASFALRLACLVLAKPRKRRLLVLDEPFRFVSRNYIQNVGRMLHQLSQEFGIQFLIVTHLDDLHAGKVIKL